MSNSHCTGHEPCPRCRSNGNDRGGDNLAVYSDGHKYCFRCGYTLLSSGIERLQESTNTPSISITLPADVDEHLPRKARDFTDNYALTNHDITNNTILWSEHWQRLIFPYFDDTGLLGWQGRYLGDENKAKWFSQGRLHEFIHLVGNQRSRVCVLTEDIVSAIKVSHNTKVCACPIFGSHISMQRLLQLKQLFDKIIIWLDDDMKLKVVKYAQQAQSIGLPVATVFTSQDPKELSDTEIKKILNDFTTD